ncbi:MAG: hypothetical protein WCG80_11685 [Spirochaetales bacterium]
MISAEKQEVLRLFAAGRKCYKLMEFTKALELFDQALLVDPKDGPSKEYARRCRDLIENPPPEDWDGVFTMTHK